jgi:hypothetical protein
MSSNVFPLKTETILTIDSVFSSRTVSSGASGKRAARQKGAVRSEVLSRSRRYQTLSFSGDASLYHAYAVETLGVQPSSISSLRTIDAARHPDFAGITDPKRPFSIVLPVIPALPDFSEAEAAWTTLSTRFRSYGEDLSAGLSGFRLGLSARQVAYVPLVGAMALGMVSAFALEYTLGSGVQADEAKIIYVDRETSQELLESELEDISVFDTEQLLAELASEDPDTAEFERRVRKMVEGYPIEDMVPEIIKQDRTVAMFLVAIAKKESNWGKRVPLDDNYQDCYNYWGYRGIRNMMGTGGHTCFNSRADAVKTVGKRLSTLINEYDLDTPEELIVWKCGSSCAGHSSYSVQKWISDVELYFDKVNEG